MLSETPGLGAEIATDHFQNEFKDKNVLEEGAIALGVVKNGKIENLNIKLTVFQEVQLLLLP